MNNLDNLSELTCTLADNLTAIVRERGPVRVTTDGETTEIAPLTAGGRFCQSPFALYTEFFRLDPFAVYYTSRHASTTLAYTACELARFPEVQS